MFESSVATARAVPAATVTSAATAGCTMSVSAPLAAAAASQNIYNPSLLNNRGQDDVRVALHAGATLGISAHQIEASALVGLRPHHHAQQTVGHTSVLTQPLFELNPHSSEQVPYISLDEFLASDNEEIKTTTNNQDLCMRLDQHQQNHEQQQDGTTTLILQPPPPHNQQHLNLQTEKTTGKTGEQNILRNFSLTPSPSSSSSFENEEEMGCVGPPPFTLYRRNPAPVKLNFRESALSNSRLSVSSPMTEGSDEELEMQSSVHTGPPMTLAQKEAARRSKKPVPDEKKDETYWKRRHKNNMAAKRSREARRMKETDLSKRASVLEMEHDQLKNELDVARQENEELRLRLSKYENIANLNLK